MNLKRILIIVFAVSLMLTGTPMAQANNPTATETWCFRDAFEDASGDGWVWDNATNTLTLTDFTLNSSASPALRMPTQGGTIVLNGTSRITATNTHVGITCGNRLTFAGAGSLEVTLNSAGELCAEKIGIVADAIELNDATVNVAVGDASGSTLGVSVVRDGLVVNSGALNVVVGNARHVQGIHVGNITLNGGAVNVESGFGEEFSLALHARYDFEMSGGTLTVASGDAQRSSTGVRSISFTLNGGEVNVTSGNASSTTGINAWNIVMNGGTLGVRSGVATAHSSAAVHAINITINNGNGSVEVADTGVCSQAMVAYSETIAVSDGISVTGWDGSDYTIPGQVNPLPLARGIYGAAFADINGTPLTRLQFGPHIENVNLHPPTGR